MTALPDVAAIEAAALTAWPAVRVAHDGLWVWRGSGGYTKRANAIHCLDPSDGDDAEERLARLAALSVRHGIPPVFRVTPLTSAGAIRAIAAAGWVEHDASRVMVMELPDADWPVPAPATLHEPADREWIATQAGLLRLSDSHREALAAIVSVIACPARGVLVRGPDGRPVGAALAAVHNGVGIYLSVVVDPTMRRRGYGRTTMAAALNWTRGAGARHAAIQVLGSNERAISLYGSLGFAERYGYHYRVAPGGGRP